MKFDEWWEKNEPKELGLPTIVNLKYVCLSAWNAAITAQQTDCNCNNGQTKMKPNDLIAKTIKKMDYKRHDIFLNIESETELMTRLNSCKKEPETVEWIEDNFKKGDVFFDIGANVGVYSLVTAKFLRGKVKIYAFEPGFSNYRKLCENVRLNDCQDCIVPIPLAVSDVTGLSTFNYSSLIVGNAAHALGESLNHLGKPFTPVFKQKMLSFKIDELVQYLGFPDWIKIDVDGIENLVLIGADNTLRNTTVKSVLVEVIESRPETQEIVDFLAERGFVLKSKHKYVYGISPGHNYIFVR